MRTTGVPKKHPSDMCSIAKSKYTTLDDAIPSEEQPFSCHLTLNAGSAPVFHLCCTQRRLRRLRSRRRRMPFPTWKRTCGRGLGIFIFNALLCAAYKIYCATAAVPRSHSYILFYAFASVSYYPLSILRLLDFLNILAHEIIYD